MTKYWRMSVVMTREMEQELVKLRQRDEYARCSLAEIVRRMVEAGLKAEGYTTCQDQENAS